MRDNKILFVYGNTYCVCVTHQYFDAFYKHLSVRNKDAFWIMRKRPGWDGYHHFFSKQTGKFPTGHLGMLLTLCDEQGWEYEINGSLPPKIEYKDKEIEGVVLRDYQKYAIRQGLEYGRGIFHCATGSGKTEIACALIREINQPTLIIVHMKELFNNFYDRLEKRLGVKIGQIRSAEDGSGYLFDPQKVTVAMIQSCYKKVPNKNDTSTMQLRMDLVKYLQKVQVIIGDEVHHLKANTQYHLFSKCPAPYRFGFSGTPTKDDDPVANFKLQGATGSVIAKVDSKYMIEEGFASKPFIRMLKINEPCAEGTYLENYRTLIVESIYRNNLIRKVCEKHNKGTLILVRQIGHGIHLYQLIKHIAKTRFICGSSKGNKKSIEDFAKGKLEILIATSILDEGVDINNVFTMVLAGASKSSNKVIQQIGRGIRLKTIGENKVYIYDFIDMGSKYLRNASRSRYKTYKNEGFDVKIKDLTQGGKLSDTTGFSIRRTREETKDNQTESSQLTLPL